MFCVKIFLVFVGICSTAKADVVSNIPIVGGVLGTLTNASREVINSAVNTVQYAGEQILKLDFIAEIIKTQLHKLLAELPRLMLNEITLLGLPRLEPLEIEHVDIDISHEIGVFKGTMDNVVITRLSEFIIDDIKVIVDGKNILLPMFPNISVSIHYDQVDVKGDYDINAYVGDLFDIWGKGPFNLTLRGLYLHANAYITIDIRKKQIRLEDIVLDVKLQNMTCNLENLMGGGETGILFNKVLGELAPEAVEVLWPEIRPGLQEKVKEVVNIKILEIGFDAIWNIIKPKMASPEILQLWE